jgi:hypothetical protein
MIPTTRQEFKDFCLRALGYPVLEINVTDEQIDDRIDYSLQMYYDYHFDGSEKIYYRHQIRNENKSGCVSEIEVSRGGTGYSNSDTVVITPVSLDNGTGPAATLTTSGNVGIGVTPSYKLDVSGEGRFTGNVYAPVFQVTSDEQLKTNLQQIIDPLGKINDLEGIKFDWTDNTGTSYGFIAQQVERIIPEVIGRNGEYKTVNYIAVIPILVEALKEQQKRIKILEKINKIN